MKREPKLKGPDEGELPRRWIPTRSAVAACLLDGMSQKEIARAIGRSVSRVEEHVRALRVEFGARNCVQLGAALAVRRSEAERRFSDWLGTNQPEREDG